MYTYRIYGLIVKSEIELPSAMPCDNDKNEDILIKTSEINNEYEIIQEIEKKSDASWFQKLGKIDSVIYIRKIGLFRITDGKLIEYRNTVNLDKYQLEQWILNMCISIAVIQRGKIILHGSGIQYKKNLVIVSGESGSGKSTLSNELLDDGLKFVSDDSVFIEVEKDHAYGKGAYPLRRLCNDVIEEKNIQKGKMVLIPDGGKVKYGVPMNDEFDGLRVPLKYLFILNVDEEQKEVSCQEILNSDKLNAIIECLYKKQSYQMIGFDQRMMFELIETANKIRIFTITRPKGKMTVKEQKRIVYDILRKDEKI